MALAKVFCCTLLLRVFLPAWHRLPWHIVWPKRKETLSLSLWRCKFIASLERSRNPWEASARIPRISSSSEERAKFKVKRKAIKALLGTLMQSPSPIDVDLESQWISGSSRRIMAAFIGLLAIPLRHYLGWAARRRRRNSWVKEQWCNNFAGFLKNHVGCNMIDNQGFFISPLQWWVHWVFPKFLRLPFNVGPDFTVYTLCTAQLAPRVIKLFNVRGQLKIS